VSYWLAPEPVWWEGGNQVANFSSMAQAKSAKGGIGLYTWAGLFGEIGIKISEGVLYATQEEVLYSGKEHVWTLWPGVGMHDQFQDFLILGSLQGKPGVEWRSTWRVRAPETICTMADKTLPEIGEFLFFKWACIHDKWPFIYESVI
jgi:hypothetical protein